MRWRFATISSRLLLIDVLRVNSALRADTYKMHLYVLHILTYTTIYYSIYTYNKLRFAPIRLCYEMTGIFNFLYCTLARIRSAIVPHSVRALCCMNVAAAAAPAISALVNGGDRGTRVCMGVSIVLYCLWRAFSRP